MSLNSNKELILTSGKWVDKKMPKSIRVRPSASEKHILTIV